MKIQEQLILDIQRLNPQLMGQVYNFTEQLHKLLDVNAKRKENYNFENHPFKKFFGIITDKEAKEMRLCIDHEFNKIEGEW
jgi:hypothetical protein